MSNFTVSDISFEITDTREYYNKIRIKYQRLADKEAQHFATNYSSHFKSIDDIYEKCEDIAMRSLASVVSTAVKDCLEKKVYVDEEALIDNYLLPYLTWEDDFSKVVDPYLKIIGESARKDEHRRNRRENRGQIIGGGFGVGGAVKGMAQAAAMNAGIGAVHMLANGTGKMFSAIGDSIKKQELFNDPSTKQHLVNAIFNLAFQVHIALIDAINHEHPATITGYLSDDDIEQARRRFELIQKGHVKGLEAKKLLLETIQLNPYEGIYYEHFLKAYNDKEGALERLSLYFGIDAVTHRKKALIDTKLSQFSNQNPRDFVRDINEIEKYATELGYSQTAVIVKKIKKEAVDHAYSLLDKSTPESCLLAVPELKAYAESVGASLGEISGQLTSLNGLATSLDIQRRTVDGKVYKTFEEAQTVIEEAKQAKNKRDNTVVSSSLDVWKIICGVVCLLICVILVLTQSMAALIFFGIGGYCFKSVRSKKGLSWASNIGKVLVGLGLLLITPMLTNGTPEGALLSVGMIVAGYFIVRISEKCFSDSEYGVLSTNWKKVIVIAAIPTVLIYAVLNTTYGQNIIKGMMATGPVKPALPFVGVRSFNFAGGFATGETIEIRADGHVLVQSHGTSGDTTEYSGPYVNPIPLSSDQALEIKGKNIFLLTNGVCKNDGTDMCVGILD